MFQKMDTNKDGVIDKTEADEGFKAIQNKNNITAEIFD